MPKLRNPCTEAATCGTTRVGRIEKRVRSILDGSRLDGRTADDETDGIFITLVLKLISLSISGLGNKKQPESSP